MELIETYNKMIDDERREYRERNPKTDSKYRASSSGMCARKIYFEAIEKAEPTNLANKRSMRIMGLGTTIHNEIQNSLTVEDSTHQITFKTPPSENVEIEATGLIDVLSTDTEIHAALSDNSTYNSIAAQFEYDAVGIWFSDDEASDKTCVVKWVLGALQLASIGSNNTFWIGFSTAGATKSAYLKYGLRASHGVCDHPFVIKATALPSNIYDGQ